MADFPALPLWTDRYLADTRHLTLEEDGAYLLLMMEAWRRPRCTLPDDDDLLAKLTKSSPSDWARLKPVVMALWTLDRRRKEWRQKRLSKERKFVEEKRRQNRDKARKRWDNTKKQHATAMPRQCDPTPTPTSTTDAKVSAVARVIDEAEEQQLLTAAGAALGASPNLFVMATPMSWLSAGVSWELDVLPVIRHVASRSPPGRINNWNYFSQAIADHHVKRTAAMPNGDANGHAQQRRTAGDVAREFARHAGGRGGNHSPPIRQLPTAGR